MALETLPVAATAETFAPPAPDAANPAPAQPAPAAQAARPFVPFHNEIYRFRLFGILGDLHPAMRITLMLVSFVAIAAVLVTASWWWFAARHLVR
jgi:hypothetical protein